MSTYNGEKYLREQIESILQQENVDVEILVRDDGSTDSTCEILNEYEQIGKLKWYSGKNLKSAYSFFDLVINAPYSRYYAFSDQDDVWNRKKLRRALNMLNRIKEKNIPQLYCSNYQLVNQDMEDLKDNGHVSTTKFNEAIVSSCCTGCTMVFNDILLGLVKKELPQIVVMHDDWIHKVCLALNGKVIYDKTKTIKYRQHSDNVDGGVHTIRDKILQSVKRMKTKECVRSKQLGELLRIYGELMSLENKDMLNEIVSYKNYGIIKRLKLAFFSKIKTPYRRLNKGFYIAIILKYF